MNVLRSRKLRRRFTSYSSCQYLLFSATDEILRVFYNLIELHLENNQVSSFEQLRANRFQVITDSGVSCLFSLEHLVIMGDSKIRHGLTPLTNLKSLELVNTNICGMSGKQSGILMVNRRDIGVCFAPPVPYIIASIRRSAIFGHIAVAFHLSDVSASGETGMRYHGRNLIELHESYYVCSSLVRPATKFERLHLIEQDLVSDDSICILTQLTGLCDCCSKLTRSQN